LSGFADIWSYLAREPLLWLTATLVAYVIGDALSRAAGRHPLVNPVLIAVGLLVAVLLASGTPYATYFEGAKFVHFMLGPATVALAVPLWDNRKRIRRALWPMLAALVAGSATAMVSALALARAFGLGPETLASLAPKSVTAPVAIGVAEGLGGSPTLAAVLVILTGISGAVLAGPVLDLLDIRDPRARGFATGIAAHGIGTARAFQEDETAGAFSGIAMGLNALLTALIAPLILHAFLP
jgi:predicted murein hydrolase (TIGR00659 family)